MCNIVYRVANYPIEYHKEKIQYEGKLFIENTALTARNKALEYLNSIPFEKNYSVLFVEDLNNNFDKMNEIIASNALFTIKSDDIVEFSTLVRGLVREFYLYDFYNYDIGGSPIKIEDFGYWHYILPYIPNPLEDYIYNNKGYTSLNIEHKIKFKQEQLQYIKLGLKYYIFNLVEDRNENEQKIKKLSNEEHDLHDKFKTEIGDLSNLIIDIKKLLRDLNSINNNTPTNIYTSIENLGPQIEI